jgi:hypothetical protein
VILFALLVVESQQWGDDGVVELISICGNVVETRRHFRASTYHIAQQALQGASNESSNTTAQY